MKRKTIFSLFILTTILLVGCTQGNVQKQDNSVVPESTVPSTDTTHTTTPSQENAEANMISEEEAKIYALNHAGLTEDQVTFIKCELDKNHDEVNYDVEFYTEEQLEYDYEIDAYTGKILGYDLDGHYTSSANVGNSQSANNADTVGTDSSITAENNSVAENTNITEEDAKRIALEQVPGATDENIREIHKDYDDGRLRYEVEIFYDQKEYEFDIDAQNGSILEWDKY